MASVELTASEAVGIAFSRDFTAENAERAERRHKQAPKEQAVSEQWFLLFSALSASSAVKSFSTACRTGAETFAARRG